MNIIDFNYDEYDLFEGMTSISSVIDSIISKTSDRKITKVLYNEDKKSSKYNEIKFLEHKAFDMGFEIEGVNHIIIDKIAQGKTHGGIVAICSKRNSKILQLSDIRSNGFYVILEGIEDPYNFGYAVRSLYASGADGIIISDNRFSAVQGLICKASAGTSELIDTYFSEPSYAIGLFKQQNYKIVCAGIRNSLSLYDADLKKPILLVLGGEKRGISHSVLEKSDFTVRIDYGKAFRGSLPTSSAATVLAFEIYRQNK